MSIGFNPTLSPSNLQHANDNYHHTIPLKRVSTHPTDVLYDHPIPLKRVSTHPTDVLYDRPIHG